MNERFKQLRTTLNLSQRDFSSQAKIGHSTLAMFESGQRTPKDIHISQICQTFNVNEDWLRTGEGSIFIENDQTLLDEFIKENHLDDTDRKIFECYLKLTDSERAVMKKALFCLATSVIPNNIEESATVEIDQKVDAYRQELEAEQKGATLLVFEDIKEAK